MHAYHAKINVSLAPVNLFAQVVLITISLKTIYVLLIALSLQIGPIWELILRVSHVRQRASNAPMRPIAAYAIHLTLRVTDNACSIAL